MSLFVVYRFDKKVIENEVFVADFPVNVFASIF